MKNQLSMSMTGLIIVLVGYASSAVIVYQAALMTGASSLQIESWMWALGVGMGLSTIALSLYYRKPLLTAWSTPGAALLVTSLGDSSLSEAIAGFWICALLITICGVFGLMDQIMRWIPKPLAAAMLAGVLAQFVFDVFVAAQTQVLLILPMLFLYLIGKHVWPKFNIPVVLIAGLTLSFSLGLLESVMDAFSGTERMHSSPQWMVPEFTLQALVGVALPLFVVTMCSQNLPGLAVLQANNIQVKASPLITTTGLTGLLLAPFGGFAFNLSAITAAMCMGADVHPDPRKRYWAAVWAGVFYLLMGIFAATVTQLLMAFPSELIMGLAGLALLTTFGSSLREALGSEEEAALLTFLVTASGMSLLGIGSAFWGILLGLILFYAQPGRRMLRSAAS